MSPIFFTTDRYISSHVRRLFVVAPRFGLPLLAAALSLLLPAITSGQGSGEPPRITARVDESNRTALRGNTHPLARAQYDQGVVADSQPIRRMLMLLQRSAAQEAALKQFVDEQQSKSSANYHQWLTPQQIGRQYGPEDADVQIVTSWLESHGFQVARVSAAKTLIEFSGTAGQVNNAFHTQIHRYVVNGEEHFANSNDPQIPAALAPVVAGPVSLHNFVKKAQSHNLGVFRKTKATGRVAPLYSFSGCSTITGAGATCNALGPGDFAKIYNLLPLWNATPAIDGTGQTIAIVGDSEICTTNSPDFSSNCSSDDVATFRSIFGLPANSPNVILDGPDPGFTGDEIEGDLDVQWSGAVAKNASIDFVIAENTESTAGIDLAAEYIVDNNLAPVMSESFGACEYFLGNSNNQFYATIWEQAAAQGITVVVSTGDSGSDGCDNRDATSPNPAQNGVNVNGIASTPFTVAAGGTDFDITASNYESAYWGGGTNSNAAVRGIKDVSALSYIPETTWNDSCAQNFTGAVTGCNPPPSINSVNIVAGGGGQSTCALQNSRGTVCTQYYAKPSWQTTASELPSGTDIARDLPDIALFSADGFVSNSFYIICASHLTNGTACNLSTSYVDFVGVGGTSSAAPTFAAMMALVNQNMVNNSQTGRQGNANFVLYHLGANQSGLTCLSSAGPAPGCTFNDVTKGNNSVPCAGTTPNCSNTTNSGTYGVLETVNSTTGLPTGTLAFNAGTGFDLATGLGSINATNLVNNWVPAVGAFRSTATSLCLSISASTLGSCVPGPIAITHGGTVYVNIGVTPAPPTGTAALPEDASLLGTFTGGSSAAVDHFTSNNYVISNSDIYPLSNGTVSGVTTTDLVGGSYTVIAHYAGDGTFGGSDSTSPVSVIVNPEGSVASVSAETFNPIAGSLSRLTSVPYGDFNLIRVDVQGASSGQESATGTVTLTDESLPIVDPNGNKTSTFTLNTEGYLEDQTTFLAVGAHNFQATYNGDTSYNTSAKTAGFAFSVTQAATTTTVTASANPVQVNATFSLTAFVDTQSATNPSGGSSGLPPTGTVTFLSGSTQLGAAAVSSAIDGNGFVAAQLTLPSQKVATASTLSITAVYSGDGNYSGSTSPAIPVVVTNSTSPLITVIPAASTVNISAPGQSGSTRVTITEFNGFSGAVTLTYSVSPSNVNDPPTCSFNPTVLTLSTTTTSAQSTIICSTTAVTSLVGPTTRPKGPSEILIEELAVLLTCLFLLGVVLPRRRGLVTLAVLLLTTIAVTTSCGGGAGGGSTNSGGTTVDAYTVTVTGTPASGNGASAQTTTITFNVQ